MVQPRWTSLAELADLLEARARQGRPVRITADTARLIAIKLRTADAKPTRDDVALALCTVKVKCARPCFDCAGKANIVVRAYGQSFRRDR